MFCLKSKHDPKMIIRYRIRVEFKIILYQILDWLWQQGTDLVDSCIDTFTGVVIFYVLVYNLHHKLA